MKMTLSIDDIAGYIRNAEKTSLILGAGASKSAGIPLASELIAEIHANHSYCLSHLSPDDHNDYGKVMGALPPNVRRNILRHYLEKASINWGHIALAHMVRHTSIRRVLSCNFDDILERALSLLGDHIPIYDFGIAPTKHFRDLTEPAIFHLHGQGYGMRMFNSDEETRDHADALTPLLSDSLHSHLTVVAGYSGEADAIFDVIDKNYQDDTPLIWLGYTKDIPHHLEKFFDNNRYAHYVGDCSFDETMFELAHKVSDNWPPPLLIEPLQHVTSLIKRIPAFPNLPKIDASPFDLLGHMTTRVQRAQQSWNDKYTDENKEIRAFLSDELASLEEPLPSSEEALSIRAQRLTRMGYILAQCTLTLPEKKRDLLFQEAERFFHKASTFKGKGAYFTYLAWGLTFSQRADHMSDLGEKILNYERACGKCKEAHSLNPQDSKILELWTTTLFQMANLSANTEEQYTLLSKAAEKCNEAHSLNPRDSQILELWALTLRTMAKHSADTEEQYTLLSKTNEKYNEANSLNPLDDQTLAIWETILDQLISLPLTDEQKKHIAQKRVVFDEAKDRRLSHKREGPSSGQEETE